MRMLTEDAVVQAPGTSPGPSEEPPEFDRAALLRLLSDLQASRYEFVTVTLATHARVVARADYAVARDLRDVLGWSLKFDRRVVESRIFALLDEAGVLVERPDGLFACRVRVSSVEGTLFLHSAYPTTAHDAVFLGPDSHRFAQLNLARMAPDTRTILDYGAGAGVGGIVAARAAAGAHLTLADVNGKALFLASINAEHAGVPHATVLAEAPDELAGPFDLMVTHPPFMIDPGRRAYRDGGDLYGGRLSLDWVLHGIGLLGQRGRLILHTGASIVRGRDVLHDALTDRLPKTGLVRDYRELDPDIFGEEIATPAYADVERIAAVGLVLSKADA